MTNNQFNLSPKWFKPRNRIGNYFMANQNNKTYQAILNQFKNKTILEIGTVLYHASDQKQLRFKSSRSKAIFFGLDPYISIFYALEKWKKQKLIYLHKLKLKKNIEYTFIDDRNEPLPNFVSEYKQNSKNKNGLPKNPFYIHHIYEGKHGQPCQKGEMVCVHPQLGFRYKNGNTKNKYNEDFSGDIYLEVTFPTRLIEEYLVVDKTYIINKAKVAELHKTPNTNIKFSEILRPVKTEIPSLVISNNEENKYTTRIPRDLVGKVLSEFKRLERKIRALR